MPVREGLSVRAVRSHIDRGTLYAVRLAAPDPMPGEAGEPVSCATGVVPTLRSIYATIDAGDREAFVVLALNARARPVGFRVVGLGTATGCLVHPREVFTAAFALGATSVIVAHNHPSGDPTPSADDDAITHRLVSSGELLGVKVLDHIVLGSGARFASYVDAGRLS